MQMTLVMSLIRQVYYDVTKHPDRIIGCGLVTLGTVAISNWNLFIALVIFGLFFITTTYYAYILIGWFPDEPTLVFLEGEGM